MDITKSGLQVLLRAFHTTTTIGLVQAFLEVADKPGQTVGEIADRIGVLRAVASRLLADLTDRSRHGAEGYGVIRQTKEGPVVRNWLTVKGVALAGKLAT
jgi:hypothetical protein